MERSICHCRRFARASYAAAAVVISAGTRNCGLRYTEILATRLTQECGQKALSSAEEKWRYITSFSAPLARYHRSELLVDLPWRLSSPIKRSLEAVAVGGYKSLTAWGNRVGYLRIQGTISGKGIAPSYLFFQVFITWGRKEIQQKSTKRIW